MKNTTAEYRINAIMQQDESLLEKRIFINNAYTTIKDYLTSVFKDSYDFNAETLASQLRRRVALDVERYKNYLYTTVLADEKYSTKIKKGPNQEQSFIEYLQGMNQENLVDINNIKFGPKTITLDELFEKFSKDRYIEEELEETYEPTAEEENIASVYHIIANTLYDVIKENNYDIEAVQKNGTLTSYLFGEFAESIQDPESEEKSGMLKHKIESELKKVFIKKDDRTEVERIEEMEVGSNYVTTASLSKLTPNEIKAVLEGLDKNKRITMNGDDDEEVETIEEPEIIATMRAK